MLTIKIPSAFAGDISDLPILVDPLPVTPTWRIVPDYSTHVVGSRVGSLDPVVGNTPALQADAALRPTVVTSAAFGGVKVLRFADTHALLAATPGKTMYVVGNMTDTVRNGQVVGSAFAATLSQASAGKSAQVFTGGGSLSHTTGPGAVLSAGPFVWVIRIDGSNSASLFNGDVRTGTTAASSTAGIRLGGSTSSLDVAEAGVYSDALADAQMLSLTTYLRAKYGF